MRTLLIGFIIFCLSHVSGNLVAYAYIPPSPFIVKTWVGKHAGVKTVKIRSTVTAFSGEKATDVHFTETTQFNADTLTFRSWATDENEKKLYSVEKNLTNLSPVSKVLLLSDSREVIRVLRERGIPVRTEDELLAMRTELDRSKSENEAIARWNGGLAWVIGSIGPGNDSTPQLWFEKDTFLPLRIVYVHSKDREVYEFRFDGYRFSREYPYPRTLNIFKKGNGTLLSSQLVELSASSDHSKQSHSETFETGFTDAGNALSSAEKDLIRLYYDSVR